ncbi:hypothetical protein C8R47DRAFT_1223858 [Mycena vitilis]|nr:hypothetical protein C8R47DRAFT_1223858 [Mycena vitilis]
MVLFPRSLTSLPIELLLIIVGLLWQNGPILSMEFGETETARYTRDLHSLSLVSRNLRQLSLPRLFAHLKITNTRALRLLKMKCIAEPRFAAVIKRLDLAHVDSPEEREDRRNRLQSVSTRRGTCGSQQDLNEVQYRYGPDMLPTILPRLTSLEILELGADQIDRNLLHH